MPTYILLTRMTPAATRKPGSVEKLGKEIGRRVRQHCPSVKWKAHYATMGPYDYIDIFEAKDETEASEVSLITRAVGHAQTETWPALPYERFVALAKEVVTD